MSERQLTPKESLHRKEARKTEDKRCLRIKWHRRGPWPIERMATVKKLPTSALQIGGTENMGEHRKRSNDSLNVSCWALSVIWGVIYIHDRDWLDLMDPTNRCPFGIAATVRYFPARILANTQKLSSSNTGQKLEIVQLEYWPTVRNYSARIPAKRQKLSTSNTGQKSEIIWLEYWLTVRNSPAGILAKSQKLSGSNTG